MNKSFLTSTLLFVIFFCYGQEPEKIEYAQLNGGNMVTIYPRAERYIFTKDSICFRIEYDYLLPLEIGMKTNPTLWKDLVSNYNSVEFHQLPNGDCHTCHDAIDIEIKVFEKNKPIKSVINNFPKTAISAESILNLVEYIKKNYETLKGFQCEENLVYENYLKGTWYMKLPYSNSILYNFPIENWVKKYEIESDGTVKVSYSDSYSNLLKMKKFDEEMMKKFDTGIGKLKFNEKLELVEIHFENLYYIVNHRNWNVKNEIQIIGWNK